MMWLWVKTLHKSPHSTSFAYYSGKLRRGFLTVIHLNGTVEDPHLFAEMRCVQYLLQEHQILNRTVLAGQGIHIGVSPALLEAVIAAQRDLHHQPPDTPALINNPSIRVFSSFLYFFSMATWGNIAQAPDMLEWPTHDNLQHPRLFVETPYETIYPMIETCIGPVYITRHAIEQCVHKLSSSPTPFMMLPKNKPAIYLVMSLLKNKNLKISKLDILNHINKVSLYNEVPIILSIPSSHLAMTTALDEKGLRWLVTTHVVDKKESARRQYYTDEEVAAGLHIHNITQQLPHVCDD